MTNVLVVIPIFNEETLLWHALERLFWEEMPSGYNINVLIVDDGSTDKSREVYLSHPETNSEKIHN